MIDTHQQCVGSVLIISHDVVGTHMAGPGIRYWEMARVLSAQHAVTLIAPQAIDRQPPSFTCGSYVWGDAASLAHWLHNADIVVANGMLLLGHPELAHIRQPLVLDLYDPIMLENLELLRTAPADQRTARTQQDVALLQQQLGAGDFLLCATERQRDLYIGALMLSGRITPAIVDHDPQLRGLIDVVSSGLPAEPPIKQCPVLRTILPGIGADDVVLLWTGGLWDWMDPLTLVRAMPQVVADCPHVRLVFLAGQHPGNIHPMRMPQEARALADALGLLNRYVFFYDHWVAYEQRADFLLEADIAISLHRDHLETAYAAIRSRFFDHLWAELPSVVSAGDAAAELVRQTGIGRVVATADPGNIAATLVAFVHDANDRYACRARIRSLAVTYTWEHTLQPVSTFCRRPRKMSDRSSQTDPAPEPVPDSSRARNAALSQLDQLWQIQPQDLTSQVPLLGQVKQSANTLTRWYVQPLIDQQNTFNAAVVHALQQMAEAHDRHTTNITQHLYSLQDQVDRLAAYVDQFAAHTETHGVNIARHLTSLQQQVDQLATHVEPHLEHVTRHVTSLQEHVEQLIEAGNSLHQHVADIEVHLCDIDDAQTLLAQQLAAPEAEQQS